MSDLPPMHVVIVAYGSPLLLESCLRALGDGFEVVIVDNSSSENVSALAGLHSCRYIDPGTNIGFAAGINRAIAELGPDHGDLLLLNPDARIGGDVVRRLQDELRSPGHDRVACVSPVSYTHLDVYKRQRQGTSTRTNECARSPGSRPDGWSCAPAPRQPACLLYTSRCV